MSEIQKYLEQTFKGIEDSFTQRMNTHATAIKVLQEQTKQLQIQQNNWEQSLKDLAQSYNKLLSAFHILHEKINANLNEK